MSGFFNRDASRTYDQKNSRLAPISVGMHFLTGLVLQALPARARVLCVGVGTGADILALAGGNPGWSFVGVDPSGAMLEVCQERMAEAGILDRCTFVEGYVQDVSEEEFDAAVCFLVGHFVSRADRPGFYGGMAQRLKSGGILVNTEISYDLDSGTFPSMLDNWRRVQALMGANPDSLVALPQLLREKLAVLPPQEVEQVMRASGFPLPIHFFQAFMIAGWYASKR